MEEAMRISIMFAAAFLASCVGLADAQTVIYTNANIISMDKSLPESMHGYMVIENERVQALGEGAAPQLSGALQVDLHGRWIVPGFVSAHSHLWQSGFIGLAPNANLEDWLDALYGRVAPTLSADTMGALTRRGALAHACNGITTVFNFTGPDNDGSGTADRAQWQAANESGIRFVHGITARAIGPQWSAGQALQRIQAFADWTAGQPKTSMQLGTALAGIATHQVEPKAQAAVEADILRRFHWRAQYHYLESPGSSPEERRRYDTLRDAGLIGPQTSLAHFVHADAALLSDIAARGASMSWNPLSNGRLGSGTPDIPAYMQRGILIGMGVDGEASSDRADPFENMRAGLYQVRAMKQRAAALTPSQVLQWHSLGAARGIGQGQAVGSLEPGKFADFVVLDIADSLVPTNPVDRLVLGSGTRDIVDVYIGGRKLDDCDRDASRSRSAREQTQAVQD
jgi:cytosine/adenosine deaminase-related metal-dependent hydrolase